MERFKQNILTERAKGTKDNIKSTVEASLYSNLDDCFSSSNDLFTSATSVGKGWD